MHKDLSDPYREQWVEYPAADLARDLHSKGYSLAQAREAWINAFDKAVEELDNA